ncbi:MAG: RHS repeat domain-containing protein [Blastocatellales bacterium]
MVKAIDAGRLNGSGQIVRGEANYDYRDNFGAPDGNVQSAGNPSNTAPSELSAVGQSAYALPFKVTNALGHTLYAQFNYYLARPVDVEDANNVKSSIYYDDPLDRPTKGVRAIGTAVASQTLLIYNDSNSTVNGTPPRSIMTISDKDVLNESNSGNGLKAIRRYDGLGRAWRNAVYEGNTGGGNTWLLTDTQFDGLGRGWKTSNPFRNTDPGTTTTPSEWTTTDYDILSRVIKVTLPDTAEVKTAYSGNRVMVRDQAGKKRLSETNALGNQIKVWEIMSPDPGEAQITFTGSTTSDLNGTYNVNLTSYSYDTLNNLLQVAQGSQRRWFAYDSLSRLIRARKPEQGTYNFTFNPPQSTVTVTVGAESNSNWSSAYVYDPNGNLIKQKAVTGPSGAPTELETSYIYDALNRNTQTAYSSYPNGSFYVDRFYDGATNGKGRFWYDVANNYRWEKPTDNLAFHHNKVSSYDALGRPLTHEQNFLVLEGGSWQYKPFNLSRTYDLAGNVKTQTYPSGRVVNYGYDSAGRLNSFTGKLGGVTGPGNTDVNYSTGIQYNAYGLMSRETYGTITSGVSTPIYLNLHYNNRLQMVDLRLGNNSADEWNWSRGALVFYYGTTARDGWNPFANSADNNGNVLRQVNYVPLAGGGSVVPQLDDYTYDPLNRVKSVSELQQNQSGQWTPTPVFTQTYLYDRWGNRTIDLGATTSSIPGVTRKNFVVDTATNRLTSSDGCAMTYDAAGNQTYDCVGNHYYDSENRMTKAVQGGQNNYYFYDANGKRVRRILNGSQTWGGQETWFVYGFGGELVAEYTYNQVTAPTPSAPQKEYGYRGGKMLIVWDGSQSGDDALKWMVNDHLGSTRMEANKSGSLAGIRRHDYLPFGEELVATTGLQRSGVGYEPPASNVKQKFTGSERDAETGLDLMGARYCSSGQGRFTTTDPLLASGRGSNPQSWNRYSYAFNNPMAYTDPTGMEGGTPPPVASGSSPAWFAWWRRDMEEGTALEQQEDPKKVFIFVTFPLGQQSTTAPVGTETAKIPAPDFNSLKGSNVTIVEGENVTREAVKHALAEEGATVVFIGHSTYNIGVPGQIDATDVQMGDGYSQLLLNMTTKQLETVQVRAETVCIMACDSANFVGSAFPGAKNIIGVESGSGTDVTSTTHALSRSGFAAAQQLIRGKGIGAAVAAANGAFKPIATVGGERVTFPRAKIDRGDSVVRIK